MNKRYYVEMNRGFNNDIIISFNYKIEGDTTQYVVKVVTCDNIGSYIGDYSIDMKSWVLQNPKS